MPFNIPQVNPSKESPVHGSRIRLSPPHSESLPCTPEMRSSARPASAEICSRSHLHCGLLKGERSATASRVVIMHRPLLSLASSESRVAIPGSLILPRSYRMATGAVQVHPEQVVSSFSYQISKSAPLSHGEPLTGSGSPNHVSASEKTSQPSDLLTAPLLWNVHAKHAARRGSYRLSSLSHC